MIEENYYTNKTIKLSGNYCTITHFQRSVPVGRVFRARGQRIPYERSMDEIMKTIQQNYRRSVSNFIDTIRCNVGKWGDFPIVMGTMTFNEESKRYSDDLKQWSNYLKRLSNATKQFDLKYSAVRELQKKRGRNVWHYHALFYNLPFISMLEHEKVWGLGFVWFKTIINDGKIDVAFYLTKYLAKDMLIGAYKKKKFFTSKGLLKPFRSNIEEVANLAINEMKVTKVYNVNYPYLGDTVVTQGLVTNDFIEYIESLYRDITPVYNSLDSWSP